MGKGALRPFFKGHSLKKEKEHEKKEVDKMLSHFVTLPHSLFFIPCSRPAGYFHNYSLLINRYLQQKDIPPMKIALKSGR